MNMIRMTSSILLASLAVVSPTLGEDRFQYILNTNLIQQVDFSTSGGFDPWQTTTCYGGYGQCKYMDFHVRSLESSGTTCAHVFAEEHDVGFSDLVAQVKDQYGAWTKISDDEGTNYMPKFYVEFSNTGFQYAEVRILGYGTSANDDNFLLNIAHYDGACPDDEIYTLYVTGPDSDDRYID